MKEVWERKRRMVRKYDVTADLYDGLYAEEQRRKYAILRDVLVPGERGWVLDVGCGTGLLEEELASEVEVLVGVDASRRMLMMAKKRVRPYGNADVVQADSDFLPFRDEAFTHVISFTLLQNVPNPSSVLKEIVRTAQGGSVVVISTLKEGLSAGRLRSLLSGAGLRALKMVEESVKDVVAICKKVG